MALHLHNVSWLEVAWLVIGVCVVIVTGWNLRQISKTISVLPVYKAAARSRAQALRIQIVAYGQFRTELFRVFKGIAIIVGGLAQAFTPPVLHTNPIPRTQYITVATIFVIGVLVLLPSILDAKQRLMLRNIQDEDDVTDDALRA